MSELTTALSYRDMAVRTIVRATAIWFVLKDVCNIIDIENSRNVYTRLNDDEKDVVHTMDTTGREQEMQIVSESGL